MKRALLLAAALAVLTVPAVALGFDNTEPYASNEWYLDEDQAWSFWPTKRRLVLWSTATNSSDTTDRSAAR